MAEDLRFERSHINATKTAAAELAQLICICKDTFLRNEGGLFVKEAEEVIKQIENKALDPSCSRLDEAVSRAALKAADALKILAGKVAAADRRAKPGNFFSDLGRQIANLLDGANKQMFKDARCSLRSVLSSLTEAADAESSGSEGGAPAPPLQQQQQLAPSSSTSSELCLRYQRGDCKVSVVALTPGLDHSVLHSTLWVGLSKKVESYLGCNPSNKSEVPLPEKGQAMTSVVYDGLGGVWTGHADGVVHLHLPGVYPAAQLVSSPGLPIRSMVIDSRGYCWTGDEAGIIRVLILDPRTGRLSCKVQLTPPQAQWWLRTAGLQGSAAAAAAYPTGMGRLGSGGGSGSLAAAIPVLGMLSKGLAVFSSGGEWGCNITVWHSQTYQKLEVSDHETFQRYGTTHSLAALPWEALPEVAAGYANCTAAAGGSWGNDDSSSIAGATNGVSAISNAERYATAGQPRATVPAGVVAASLAKRSATAAAIAGGRAAGSSQCSNWRLLSGHERGQVLLWQFNGMARAPGKPKLLQLLSVIGEPRPQQSAVRAMATFDDLSMLVLVHVGGDLTALPIPTPNNGAVAASSSGTSPFSAVGTPGSRPFAGAGIMFGAAAVHCWSPQVARIQAHRHPIVATATLGELLVTATCNTVKGWTAERLKLEAQGDGLMFSRRNRSHHSISTSAELTALLDAADSLSGSRSASSTPVIWNSAELADKAAAAQTAKHTVGLSPRRQPGGWSQQDRLADLAVDSGSSMAGQSAPRAAATDVPVNVPVPASCKAANPMSRQRAMELGLQLDPTGTVVVTRFSEPLHPTLQVYPAIQADCQPSQVGFVGTPPPGQQLQHRQPGLDLNSSKSAPSASNDGLQQAPSVRSDIKEHHVIVNSELVLKEPIGRGAEGKVYRGTWTNMDIAAKEYIPTDEADGTGLPGSVSSDVAMQQARTALCKESALLTNLNHPNLVRFFGVCLDPPLVVMEFYKHGNVYEMIQQARRQWVNNQSKSTAQPFKQAKYMNYFTWDRRLEMLHDVAAGMMYLHKRHYIHGDLRSPNLFVGQDGRVKIGDFGFTKRLEGKQSSMQVLGKDVTHPRWVAPELMSDGRLSAASDVYSFGIIMYELLTWLTPFHDLRKEQVMVLVPQGERPEIPADDQLPPFTRGSTCLGNFKSLMQECWSQAPAKRPDFDRITSRLKAMIRWRQVIQRNQILAGAVRRIRGAWVACAADDMPKASPCVATAVAGGAASKAAAQPQILTAAATGDAVTTAAPWVAKAAANEDDQERLPVPDVAIVKAPDTAADGALQAPAKDLIIMRLARPRTAPPGSIAEGVVQAAVEDFESTVALDAEAVHTGAFLHPVTSSDSPCAAVPTPPVTQPSQQQVPQQQQQQQLRQQDADGAMGTVDGCPATLGVPGGVTPAVAPMVLDPSATQQPPQPEQRPDNFALKDSLFFQSSCLGSRSSTVDLNMCCPVPPSAALPSSNLEACLVRHIHRSKSPVADKARPCEVSSAACNSLEDKTVADSVIELSHLGQTAGDHFRSSDRGMAVPSLADGLAAVITGPGNAAEASTAHIAASQCGSLTHPEVSPFAQQIVCLSRCDCSRVADTHTASSSFLEQSISVSPTEISIAPPAGFGAAASNTTATAVAGDLTYTGQIRKEMLNKRLGTDNEDLTLQVKNTLKAFNRVMFPQRNVGNTSDVREDDQQQDAASEVAAVPAAGGLPARTGSAYPMIPLHVGALGLPQIVSNPGPGLVVPVAAGCRYPRYPAAAVPGGSAGRSGCGFLDVKPWEKKIKVVNRL